MADDFDDQLRASNADLDNRLRALIADFDVEWERFLRDDWPAIVTKTDAELAALLAEPIGFPLETR